MNILKKKLNLDKFFEKTRFGSLLMIDYDGTMAPFQVDRMAAYPYPGVMESLGVLSRQRNTVVKIISGRSLSDLLRLIGKDAEGIGIWGSHGLEKKAANGDITVIDVGDDIKEGVKQGSDICLKYLDRECCEIKPFSIAVHWRGKEIEKLQSGIDTIKQQWQEICDRCHLEIHHFDGGIELRFKGRNKGDVVNDILREERDKKAIVYFGDDATDEDAFAALGDKGLKILVKSHYQNQKTLADMQLIPPHELLEFLTHLKQSMAE